MKIEALINGETSLSSFVEILTQGFKEVITEVDPVKSITESLEIYQHYKKLLYLMMQPQHVCE